LQAANLGSRWVQAPPEAKSRNPKASSPPVHREFAAPCGKPLGHPQTQKRPACSSEVGPLHGVWLCNRSLAQRIGEAIRGRKGLILLFPFLGEFGSSVRARGVRRL
jgi:hypothetical protein